MGTEAIYKCLKCGKEFESSLGGGFYFELFRCVKCDKTKRIMTFDKKTHERLEITPKRIGKCSKCKGELKQDLNPMCPVCKSREVEGKEITLYYD
jgi:DNA-directed RNA polymerase subunit RPC12/RpoP